MKSMELTVQVFEDFSNAETKLKNQGFEFVEEYSLNDYYFSKYEQNQIRNMEFTNLIKNSFLIRQVISETPKLLLVYKDKVVGKNGDLISEQKIETKIEKLQEALKIFECANIDCWCNLCQKIVVYRKGEVELFLQDVQNLGVFLEFEEPAFVDNLDYEQKVKLMKMELQKLGLVLGDDYFCKKVYMALSNSKK